MKTQECTLESLSAQTPVKLVESQRIMQQIDTLISVLSQTVAPAKEFEVSVPHLIAIYKPESGWSVCIYGSEIGGCMLISRKFPTSLEHLLYKFSEKTLKEITPLCLHENLLNQ